MRRTATVVLATISLLAVAIPANGAPVVSVAVVDFDFSPRSASGAIGTRISWEWGNNLSAAHDVQEDHRLFRSGSPSANASTVFTKTPSAGSYHYFCTLHGGPGGGMDGSVTIAPGTNAGPTGAPFDVVWASTATKTGKAFDVQYRVDGGRWKTWKTDAAAFQQSFGANDKPVAVRSGRKYGFRARSQADASSPTRVSGWSPTASYTAP